MSHAYPISSLLLSVFLFSGHNAFGMLKAYKIDPNETTADIHSEYLQKKAQYKNALVKNQRTEILMASLDAEPQRILFNPYRFENFLNNNPQILQSSIFTANLAIVSIVHKQTGLTPQEKVVDIIFLHGEIIRELQRRKTDANKNTLNQKIAAYHSSIEQLFNIARSDGVSEQACQNVRHFLCHRWGKCSGEKEY